MCKEIVINLISDFLFLAFMVLLGWSIYLIARRRKLLKFFGINASKELIVYLSNIRVTNGGSLGIDDVPRSYSGSTVSFGEAIQANLVPNLFSYLIPGLEMQPGILRYLLVSDIKITIKTSPLQIQDLNQNSPLITFGSPGYNLISNWVETNLLTPIKFKDDNSIIQISDLPDDLNPCHSFIQRKLDQKNGRMVFYVAGLSEAGTIGAAYFLLTEWRELYRKYKSIQPFSILISVNQNNYKSNTIILER